MKPKVSIIILRYKEKEELFNCLKSIKKDSPKVSFEAIVVDNNKKERIGPLLKRNFSWVKYIKSPDNIGYGAGNNLGAKYARGEYLFILNPDTKVLPGAIDKLVKFLEKNKKTAVVAPNLIDAQGNLSLQLGSAKLTPLRGIVALSFLNKLFPNNPISKEYWLKDIPMDKKREVGVVPGSAFLARKEVFKKIGGFDENFFLYFEESDFCKRVREIGFKIFIIPQAQIVHYWEPAESFIKSKKIFSQSRFYYFKKHYGILAAVVVEVFARFSKWHALLLVIILLGAFLRFFRIEENLVFHGELGHNYLAIKNFIEAKQIPLLGPPTSHSWLSFGPLFYWLFTPFLLMSGFNPTTGAYFMAAAGVLLIILNFLVIEKIFTKNVAIISSFLIAISPAWVGLAREARFFSLTLFFFYPLFLFLVKSLKEGGKYLFWTGFFLGVMLNFHLTPIILIPVILAAIYLKRKKIAKKYLLNGFIGFLVPNIPFLLHNLKTGFEMLSKFIIWIPYRFLGFVGLYPKNTISLSVLKANINSFYNFFVLSIVPDSGVVPLVLFVLLLLFITFEVKKKLLEKRKDIAWLLLFSFLVIGCLAIFIHGDPPKHYYLPILPLPILFLSILLNKLWRKRGRILVLAVLVIISLINFSYFFSVKWFYRPQDRIIRILVPYQLQLAVTETIIADAKGAFFELSRVGPFDYFEGDYAQNYQYLLWWLGNEPVERARLRYTIYEDMEKFLRKPKAEVFELGPVVILKEKDAI